MTVKKSDNSQPDWWEDYKKRHPKDKDEYDPRKHCCRYFWKDFCECVKNHKKEMKYAHVEDTLEWLNKNNIDYVNSGIANIVIINPKTDKVHMSLLRSHGLLKCRYSGSNKWYEFGNKKFLEKFGKSVNN